MNKELFVLVMSFILKKIFFLSSMHCLVFSEQVVALRDASQHVSVCSSIQSHVHEHRKKYIAGTVALLMVGLGLGLRSVLQGKRPVNRQTVPDLWVDIKPSPMLLTGSNKLPVVGSSNYCFNRLLRKLGSSMNIDKYERFIGELIKEGVISNPSDIFEQNIPLGIEALIDIHTPEYLKNLNDNNVGATNSYDENLTTQSLAGMFYMENIPGAKQLIAVNHHSLMKSFLTATHNTWQALKLAEKTGAAINGFGGFHHAKWSGGEGFCPLEDIVFAMNNQWKEDRANGKPESKFVIVDLDYHPDNGPESFFNQDEVVLRNGRKLLKGHFADKAHLVKILDYYVQYPGGVGHTWPSAGTEEKLVSSPNNTFVTAKKFETNNVMHMVISADNLEVLPESERYMSSLDQDLKKMMTEHKPDFVIYVNGTDAYSGVRLDGSWEPDTQFPANGLLSMKQMIDRDEKVFSAAKNYGAKIVMLPAGGYHKDCPVIMAKSVRNLISKGLLQSRVSVGS